MPVKNWNVGDVLAAADMNAWTVPLAVFKPADTARTSTTTATNDPDLQVSVAASATYAIRVVIQYKGGTNGSSDAQFQINAPASSSGFAVHIRHQIVSLTFTSDQVGLGSPSNWGTNGTGVIECGTIDALVTTTASGTLAVAWSQNTSSATATTVLANSYLIAQRIA